MKEVVELRCMTLIVVCPHCGEDEDWYGDPRGEETTCDFCGGEYRVHKEADIDYW